MTRALIALAVLAAPAMAFAEPIAVTVIDVAGDVAFIRPGRDAGVVAGVKVRFGARTVTVIDATGDTAVIALTGTPLALGAAGVADGTPGAAAAAVTVLPAPRPLEGWNEQWPAPSHPADRQAPASVPLGAGGPLGRLHATLTLHAQGAVGDATTAAGDLRGQVSYQVLRDRPLSVDVDLSARGYRAGTAGARTPIWVHAAQVRYGDAYDPQLAVGRLAWAASSVGMLDGVRAMARLGAIEVAGFGGLVPDPIDGRPDTGAARFGGEVSYDAPDLSGRPRVALTLLGSTWNGALDERRATVTAEASRGAVTASGWAEGQAFAADNPWRARAFELTGAGAAVDWQRRGQRASVDLSLARPERTLRLAAALPASWLCGRRPGEAAADPAAEPCAGDDRTLAATASVGVTRGRLSLDASLRGSRTEGANADDDLAGFAQAELRVRHHLRLVAGGAGGHASFLDWYAVEAGVALDRGRRWDLAVRYRPELVAYAGAIDRFISHTLAVDGRLHLGASLDASLALSGTTGEDRDAVGALTTLVWRPRP